MSLTTFDVYGDGGSFPDIHVTQYPLGMGKKSSSITLSRHAVVPGDISFEPDDLKKPSEEEIAELVKKTAELLADKKPTNLKLANNQKPTYIRYTPKSNGPGYNDTAKNRIIRMVEAPVDPLEPSKFRHRRVPRGPPSPPVPINHSPPRKLSVKDMAEWKIPPCISNWKNPKGYTIPLDKRLAADGRGLQETSINDNFAKLSEALYIAERKAREELDHRMRMAKQLASKQKQKKEDELRRLAMQAREERARGSTVGPNGAPTPAETEEEREAREKRNMERIELRREVEREKRMELRGKKKEKDRDISERIALGQTATNRTTESFYDTRLFNQSSGIGSGFRDDEDYNVFENPLFKTNATTYRPEKEKIALEAERSSRTEKYSRLEFEKDQDDDPFGLGQILTETKTNKRGLESEATSRNKKPRV